MTDLVELASAAEDVAPVERKLTSHDLKVGLRASFPAPGWQVFYEVGNDTGAKVRRHADAVAIGIWPSSGHKIHGFEIKVSRADFKNEMKDPTKSWPVMQYCHHWSLVTPPGLVKQDELPDNWGLLTYDGKTLRTVRTAPKLTPEALSAGFVAALVRRAGEQDGALIEAAVQQAETTWREKAAKRGTSMESWQVQDLKRRVEEAEKLASEFKALFPDVNSYNLPRFAEAVRAVQKSGVAGIHGGVVGVLNTLEVSAKAIRREFEKAGFELPDNS